MEDNKEEEDDDNYVPVEYVNAAWGKAKDAAVGEAAGDHHREHRLVPLDLQFPRCSITVFRGHIVVIIHFFFVVFHHNPSFSVLGPNIIVWHECWGT